jgi:hypothetical protein
LPFLLNAEVDRVLFRKAVPGFAEARTLRADARDAAWTSTPVASVYK